MYYEKALDASRSILGNIHPETLASINNMGNILQTQGKRNSKIMISQESMIVFYVFCNAY